MLISDGRHMLRRSLWRLGFDLTKKKRSVQASLLAAHQISVVIDAGAARGSFARAMRQDGYRGKIISFEPLPEYYAQLREVAKADSNWRVVNRALGDTNEQKNIQVAGNLMSSSFLPMLARHSESAPGSDYVRQELVTMSTLDSLWDRFVTDEDRVFMKIDAQGYEKNILTGAARSLPRIAGLQLEMSLVPLYAGAETMSSLLPYVESLGFVPVFFENGFHDLRSGHYLQADAVFFRESAP